MSTCDESWVYISWFDQLKNCYQERLYDQSKNKASFSSSRKVDQIVYDVRHVEAAFRNYMQKKRQQVRIIIILISLYKEVKSAIQWD